ncbi:AraC family transcriptional regulator ligand-binding domain-containing protein [Motiliproteus sediminis]|uniref:AraC family transcriptional regulator ligand-binding domain-containing protein n=1 Tax=Motiliproteus sediminis TaxID=1468178 RepID=UPI001AEFE15C|nr:AraC family transcriptional regulator ligand-binding domain-containing protein [Motiliproteus sediminis]
MSAATASAKLLDPALLVARHFQQDPHGLLGRIGISADAIKPAGARIPAALFSALLQELAQITDNPRIALRTGEVTQPRMLGSVGFLISTAPTLGDALQRLNDYLPLLIDGVHLSLNRDDQGATLALDLENDDDRLLAEWLLACLHNWPRWLIGKQMPLLRVELAFAQPADPALHEQFFAAEVQYEAARNQLRFNAAILDQPCLDANDELHRHHQQFADQLLSSAGRDGALVAQVKSLIRNQIAEGNAQIGRQQVARELNLSLRTLQRKLDQHGTHFQALYDQTRRDLALQMLHRGDRSFGEIGFQLGFSGLSAFQKAFKRWTGQSPGRYRDSHRPQTVVPEHALPRTLGELVADQGVGEERFYPLALQLLQQMQQALHKGVIPSCCPGCVSVANDDSGALQLSLGDNRQGWAQPLAEQLSFSAPESNGLLPERPQTATRLYELGSLYYFVLHGSAALAERDPSALLRSQLQHTPLLNKQLSRPLRRILRRLLQIDPTQRYRSLGGLEYDLRQAQRLYVDNRNPHDFSAGAEDPPDQPIPTALLVGRDEPLQQLQALLQRSRHNDGRLLLLEGASGSGKSALLDSLRIALYRSQGAQLRIALAAGDSERRYDPLFPALRRLLRNRLATPPARQELLAQQLQRQLGGRARVLLPLLPELRSLLGRSLEPTPPVFPRGGEALQQALASLLTAPRDPLLLFFDDLHYASPELLELLMLLRQQLGRQPLLLVASYDPARVDANPALRQSLPLLLNHRQSERMTLEPLTAADSQQLLQQLLGPLTAETQVLADWLHRQSGGLPAAISAQLGTLRDAGKLVWNDTEQRWCWLPQQLPAELSQPFAEALIDALQQLPAATHELLQWAAIGGERFDPAVLADGRGDPQARIEIHLWPAQQAGLIRPDGEQWLCFSHPQLRQHLLNQLSPEQAAERYWRLALALPDTTSAPLRAEQLAHAYRLRPQPRYRRTLLKLHHQAALELQRQGDRRSSLGQLDAALALLRQKELQVPDNTIVTLCRDGLRLLLRWRDPARLERWLRRLDADLPRPLPQPLVALLPIARATQLQGSERPMEARQCLLDALAGQGIRLVLQPGPQAAAVLQLTAGRAADDESPANSPLNDPQHALLAELQTLAEQTGELPLLHATLLLRTQRGNATTQALAQALLHHHHLNQPLPPAPAPQTLSDSDQRLLYSRYLPWCAPLAEQVEAIASALQQARDRGDEAAARSLLAPWFSARLWSNEPLPSLSAALLHEYRREQTDTLGTPSPLGMAIRPWLGALDPALAEQLPPAPQETAASPWHALGGIASAWLKQQRSLWPAWASSYPGRAEPLGGLLAEAQLLLFGALLQAELGAVASDAERRWHERGLAHQALRFALWADHNPALFALPAALLEAERAALAGEQQAATRAFEQALEAGEQSGWWLAALGRERYARFWERQRHPALALLLQREANRAYQRGGAATRQWQPAAQGLE